MRGKEFTKTVMVTLDGRMAMVVLPASRKIGFDLLREVSGADNVQLASERAFSDMFPGCEVGMPPFGNLYGMDVYASKLLEQDSEIAFNAGSHTEFITSPTETSSGWSVRRLPASRLGSSRRLRWQTLGW